MVDCLFSALELMVDCLFQCSGTDGGFSVSVHWNCWWIVCFSAMVLMVD